MVPEIWSATDIIFCHSETIFCLRPPPPENQNFQKELERTPEDIIILQT